ncbi:MAG: hypothetical protein OXM61_01480 [Candidatus Poribacteria bacterium]|nr:hypothetical protein [Candidatus Poribacteria bacterium]
MKKLMFLLIFTVVSITLSIHVHAATIVTDGLVSYWTFDLHDVNDGIAKDVWGENDATIKGNPKIVDGHLRQGLKFHGTGDYVILDTLSNFQSRIGASSFEFWVKTSYDKRNTLFKVIEVLCEGDQHWTDKGWGIHLNASIQAPNFHNRPDNIPQRGGEIIHRDERILVEYAEKREKGCGHSARSSRVLISDDKWHHIVYMYNWYVDEFGRGRDEKVIYIDTIRKSLGRGTSINLPQNEPFTQPVFLGAINDNGKARRYFRGIFDEVRVYDRMLTDEEVIQNFQSGIGLRVEPNQKLPTVWGALKARH